jgi:5-hydroxyisourate hydrolase-like protein (transthyretin family)
VPTLIALAASLLASGAVADRVEAHSNGWGGAGWTPATRATSGTPTTDPALNIAPNPNYWTTCSSQGAASSACTDAVVQAINNARAAEGVGPMTLPNGFAQMTPAVQTFVVSNLERVDRGLAPAAGMVGTLNSASQTAANNDADPMLASWTIGSFSANRWGSIWAGDLNALAADYDWMYNDGWGPSGSYNLDCTSATASGCWGHRDNILSPYGGQELITGVASTDQSQWLSIAQIFVAGSGSYPAFTTSWSDISGTTSTTTQTTPTVPTAPTDATSPTTDLSVTPVDPTISKLSASASVIWAGRSVTLTGRLLDATTAQPVANAPVQLCAVTRTSTAACVNLTTDANGVVTGVAKPTRRTTYWMSYAGSDTLSRSTSRSRTVQVRATAHLHSGTRNGHRLIAAALTPARGQTVRLQRLTSRGWVGVRQSSASASTLVFSRLARGEYRLVVSTGEDVLGTTSASVSG